MKPRRKKMKSWNERKKKWKMKWKEGRIEKKNLDNIKRTAFYIRKNGYRYCEREKEIQMDKIHQFLEGREKQLMRIACEGGNDGMRSEHYLIIMLGDGWDERQEKKKGWCVAEEEGADGISPHAELWLVMKQHTLNQCLKREMIVRRYFNVCVYEAHLAFSHSFSLSLSLYIYIYILNLT